MPQPRLAPLGGEPTLYESTIPFCSFPQRSSALGFGMDYKVDTSGFPVGSNVDYESATEIEGLKTLEAWAWEFVHTHNWTFPVAELVFAFGIAPILSLYLIRFQPGGKPEDAERWLVVGDLPSMNFETDDAPTPAIALRLYCAIAQVWADAVLEDGDLSECYPIEAAPTHEHARMLLSRIKFIRRKLVPLAVPAPAGTARRGRR